MITQAIKEWLQKVFAWWPWKQSTSMEYQPVTTSVIWASTAETPPFSNREGIVPQAGTTPRLSTLEGRSERGLQPRTEDLAHSSVPPSLTDLVKDSGGAPPPTPTTQQRLEFLRYLIQRGIVNEGFEKERTDL